MSRLKDLKFAIDSFTSLKGLVEVYEEMAATSMRRIRQSILSSRDYYAGLSRVSLEVGVDFASLTTQSNRLALVFLSADESLYGDLIDKVCSKFLTVAKEHPSADIYIVGSVGAQIIRLFAPQLNFTDISLSASNLKLLYSYPQVQLFFGQFSSLARQEPFSRSLSASTVLPTINLTEVKTQQLRYLYEPSVNKVSQVFAEEIFLSLFEQTSQENELAKNASRLMHLDQALNNIDRQLSDHTKRYHFTQKRISSKSQYNQIAAYKASKNIRGSHD